MFKWIKGRQDAPYSKIKILENKRFKFDCYLIKIEPETEVPFHFDTVKDFEHHRLNINFGGKFHPTFAPMTWKQYLSIYSKFKGRILKFRPDILEHGGYSELKTAYLLSIGWLKLKNKLL